MIEVKVDLNFDQIVAQANGAAAIGLNMAAERLKALSVARTPIDQGPLSAATSVIPATPGDLVAKVHNDTVYAARQHEELTWRHSNGRTAKYLEGPAEESSQELYRILAAQIRRAMR
ncbi:hypothetical protein CQ010_01535 [Arthrobacter sp. MYb211]|uniref:hypothetical protein n=1 Tax=unclassified Arthrobacter TaxID=235627 RepID=UPI000CFDFB62|nr:MULTISPECIES: hypothetical protein [unclassified Arthrobacter]PRA13356.1 hypothetical protein CQ015_03790 [Arthrobacter sp. MYb221]PRC10553.1 hypothetical protein CQ010_01535 [Arthrobacter sp. MYb211]